MDFDKLDGRSVALGPVILSELLPNILPWTIPKCCCLDSQDYADRVGEQLGPELPGGLMVDLYLCNIVSHVVFLDNKIINILVVTYFVWRTFNNSCSMHCLKSFLH